MNVEQVIDEITQIFRDLFDNDAITLSAETTAKDIPGWDSYKQVNILVAVEQHFGIKFRSREIDNLSRVGDLVSLVAAKMSA